MTKKEIDNHIAIILEYVIDNLAPGRTSDEDHQTIESFLKKLGGFPHIFSKRLLICIGIDLRVYNAHFTGKTQLKDLVENYQKVILNTGSVIKPSSYRSATMEPHVEFALALAKHGINNCVPGLKGTDSAEYLRITTFESYYHRLFKENKFRNPDFTYDRDPSNIKQFYEEFSEYDEHRNINIFNLSSSTGWVFATDKTDLQAYISPAVDLPEILDLIGYYIGDTLSAEWEKNTYIYIEYPSIFMEDMLQPTALVGDWGKTNLKDQFIQGNEFFLSYKREKDKKEKDWGKTFPVTGSHKQGVKERAHIKFSRPPDQSYPFSAGDLRDLKKLLVKVTGTIMLEEAINRFNNA